MACSRGTEIFYKHPNQKIVAWAKNFGLDLSDHNPMEISPQDMKDTTVFFVMDQSHYEYLKKISKDAQIYYLGNFSTTDKHDITDVKVRDLTIKKKEVIDTFRYIINAIDNILDTYGKIHTNNRHSCLQ